MLIRNLDVEKRLVNGRIGIVEEFDIWKKNNCPIVHFSNGFITTIEPITWNLFDYNHHLNLNKRKNNSEFKENEDAHIKFDIKNSCTQNSVETSFWR